MIKKSLILLTIFIFLTVSTTPALAKKPVETGANGNSTHQNQGKNSNAENNKADRNPANPNSARPALSTSSEGNITSNVQNDTHGFDEFGYNRTARIFNGTGMSWCMGKIGDLDWCEDYLGDNAQDKLIMKWNAEWDRGNDESWLNPPYNAWENNEWNGKVPGGSGEVWHYKIVWVGPCTEGYEFPNGGYCIWEQFEVLMDHGTAAGGHTWNAHAIPTGYGFFKSDLTP